LIKYTADRPYADLDKAARRLMQHAHAFEPVQDGRIYIEKLNGPFLFGDKGTPAEYAADAPSGETSVRHLNNEVTSGRGYYESHVSVNVLVGSIGSA
jgi:hypothetical protein